MPDEPDWIFTTQFVPDPGEDRPRDLYGEALFQQAERLVAMAQRAGLSEVSRIFGPDCWGYPRGEEPCWEPVELRALVDAMSAMVRAASPGGVPSTADEAILGELDELRAILDDENLEGRRVQLIASEAMFFG